MALIDALNNAWRKKELRGWDKIYVAVDWHDTICKSTYAEGMAFDWLNGAEETLRDMSEDPNFCLILYTCSHNDVCMEFIGKLKDEYGIKFDHVNYNPEVTNTKYGCFDDKFYYDILLDDKSGFVENDWLVIQDFMLSKIHLKLNVDG